MTALASHAARVREVLASNEISRRPLAASWQRCMTMHGLDPEDVPLPRRMSESELREIVEPMDSMLANAAPTLERLRRGTGSRGVCLLVANAEGVPVIWARSDVDADELAQRGLCPGVDWSEPTSGTNGIGTSLVERRAIIVREDQHFFAHTLSITCASAPIFDHEGMLAGAVNVTYYGRASEHAPAGLLHAAVADAARQIEIDHFHHAFDGARILSVPGDIRSGAILLAIDRDDVVVGATRGARRVLAMTPEDLAAGVVASDFWASDNDGLADAESAVIRRWLLRNGGNVTASARDLGVSHATIKRKIRRHGLDRNRLS